MKKYFLFLLLLVIPAFALADGSQSYATPGTYTFTVPAYGTLTVTVNGAGGGGAGGSFESLYQGANGSNGGNSSFNGNIIGNGAGGGSPAIKCSSGGTYCYSGASGGASGGSTDTTGGGGAGGAGGAGDIGFLNGGAGGAGGKAVTTYNAGGLTAGAGTQVVVGAGGAGGAGGYDPYTGDGSSGSNGSVTISWTSPPTCSVSFDTNPIDYGGGTTMHWTSSNATWLYINNVGYVDASDSAWVAPTASTDYSCQAGNDGGTGPVYHAVLSVNAPPTASVTANGQHSLTVSPGTTYTVAWSSTNADAGCMISYHRTDGGTPTNGSYNSGTSGSAQTNFLGTYTFTCQNTAGYSVQDSDTITAYPAPSCSFSLTPSSIPQGQSSTLSWTSQNASSVNINGIGAENPSGSTTVSPSQTTTYTGTCTGNGGTSNFPNAVLTVTCSPSTVYSCSGNNIVQTSTNAQCNVTTNSSYATCNAPSFCSAGASSCSYPAISFNPSGNQNGHLQIVPSITGTQESVKIFWNISNAQSCSVTGTNGDSWTGLSSPAGGATSKLITAQVTYTLSCQAYGSNPNVNETQVVNITPKYKEQ
jgi:hypothetical protein